MKPVSVIRPVVTQDELRALIGIKNQIRQLTKIYDQNSSELLKRMLAGASIERGVHTAEIDETFEGNARIERLIVY